MRILFFIFILFFQSISWAGPASPSQGGPVVIVDAGHGGKDPGTIGKGKIKEKEIALALSKKLTGSLSRKLGNRVYLTRSNDRYVTLEKRNELANWRQCDLFLSLHANSASSQQAEGIEIYYLNRATDTASQKLAARENRSAGKKLRALDAILSDLIQTDATESAAHVSRFLKKSIQNGMRRHGVERVEVKTALFYVLVGAKCPSLLIETGFLSNPTEAKRLKRASYQQALADSIAEGVARYFENQNNLHSDL